MGNSQGKKASKATKQEANGNDKVSVPPTGANKPSPSEMDEAKSPSSSFADELSLQVAKEADSKTPDDNIIISPYSVHSALSILLPGAGGNTLKEFLEVLHSDIEEKPGKKEGLKKFQEMKALYYFYNVKYGDTSEESKEKENTEKTILNIANRVYINAIKKERIEVEYMKSVASMYSPLDVSKPENARKYVEKS